MKQNFYNDRTGQFELHDVKDVFPPEPKPVNPVLYIVLTLLVAAIAFGLLVAMAAP